jgi:hypothetical protein
VLVSVFFLGTNVNIHVSQKNSGCREIQLALKSVSLRLQLMIHWNYRVVRYFEYIYLLKHWRLFIMCESKLLLGEEGNGIIIGTINSKTINSVDTPCL